MDTGGVSSKVSTSVSPEGTGISARKGFRVLSPDGFSSVSIAQQILVD
jgi:hypothetical protein